MISGFFSAISLASMGIFFYLQDLWGYEETTSTLEWLPLLSLITFFVAYSGGMANVPFIIMGEMFPTRFRTLLGLNFNYSSFQVRLNIFIFLILGAISSWVNLLSTFLVVRMFPVLLGSIGEAGTFFLFTTCTFLSIIFVYFLLPETKGKTLEDMEKLFTSSE